MSSQFEHVRRGLVDRIPGAGTVRHRHTCGNMRSRRGVRKAWNGGSVVEDAADLGVVSRRRGLQSQSAATKVRVMKLISLTAKRALVIGLVVLASACSQSEAPKQDQQQPAAAATPQAATATAPVAKATQPAAAATTQQVSNATPPPPVVATPRPSAPTGELQIEDVKVGTGDEALAGKSVTVHYTGWLTDGTKFDSSKDHGQPFTFQLGAGQVIRGWDQGVLGMKVGGTRKLTIPPSLAYGANGAGGTIPPNATLVFEVELLGVN